MAYLQLAFLASAAIFPQRNELVDRASPLTTPQPHKEVPGTEGQGGFGEYLGNR